MIYHILHDLNRTLCFVGNTWHNKMQHAHWAQRRDSELVSLEVAQSQDQTWFDQRQFMCAVTNISFKKLVVSALSNKNVHWFSVVAVNSMIGNNVSIGYNTLINLFNTVYDDTHIGNHVTITNYCHLSHDANIKDYCHVSPYVYLCYTTLEQGVCVGVRNSFPGKPTDPIVIPNWTNLLMEGRIAKTLPSSGTWYGNKKINDQTSLETKIL